MKKNVRKYGKNWKKKMVKGRVGVGHSLPIPTQLKHRQYTYRHLPTGRSRSDPYSGSRDWFRLYILLTSGDRCDSSCMIFSLKTTCNNALRLNGATNFVLIFNHLISLNSQHVTFFVFLGRHSLMADLMIWIFEGQLFSSLRHL